MDLYPLVRSALFRVRADRAHDLARLALRAPAPFRYLGRSLRVRDPRLETRLAGLSLANPVGLAPGFDKDGDLLPSLQHFGFGYVVIGSLTTEPRSGNPRPRLVRYPDRLSLANSMGLPNRGIDAAVRALRARPATGTTVMASVAGFSADGILEGVAAIEPHVAAVEVGLVCPNSSESERMRELEMVRDLVSGLGRRRTKPVFVKLPPHHTPEDRDRVVKMVDLCIGAGLDGVSVNGGRPVVEPGLATGRGSLAGRDTFADALRIVGEVAEHAAGRLVIRASGGVFSGRDAALMLGAGATTVEVYSSLVYRGWRVAQRINQELLEILTRQGLPSVESLGRESGSPGAAMSIWDDVIPPFEQKIYAAAGYGSSPPLGRRPVLLVVDTNYAFAGRAPRPIEEAVRECRTSCGEAAWAAIAAIQRLLPAARAAGLAVIYTTGRRHSSLSTMGQWAAKNARAAEDLGQPEATDIVAEIEPAPGEIVVEKSRPSGFFGTDLAAHLVVRRADTVLMAGGTTSGCVRATVMDAFSLGYRVGIVQECTFDRATVPHKVNLFDMQAKYANILSLDETLAYLETAAGGGIEPTAR